MDKKLYWQLIDDGEKLILTFDGCIEHIKATAADLTNGDDDAEFTLIPIWMTEDEFNKELPEYEGH